MEKDPATWHEIDDYIQAQEFVSKLLIVNDIAERGIALMSRYNTVLTHQEDQKQFLIQAMEQHCKDLPLNSLTKKILIEYLNKNSQLKK